MGIPENLKRLRGKAKLSQTKLAAMAKVSQQLISQLERGENLTTKELPALARALGVAVEEIDPSFTGLSGASDRDELNQIYERLSATPDWQAYLLDQARQLESRVLPKAARPMKKAGDAR